ncbi:unnamed protein product, partial [Adineta steineri]
MISVLKACQSEETIKQLREELKKLR